MIEELEVKAIGQLIAGGRGEIGAEVRSDHQGNALEVRARRRRDGAVQFSYRYGGVRLEKAVLLRLICPQDGCAVNQSIKREWAARNPPPPLLQRRIRGWPASPVGSLRAPLFEEAAIGGYIARPASFSALTMCPIAAHPPAMVKLKGWDVFTHGSYVAGGLKQGPEGLSPVFPSLDSARAWVNCQTDGKAGRSA